MKRFLKIFLLVLVLVVVLLIALAYFLAFTQSGNDILKPFIESKAKEASGLDIKLDKFSLRFSSIDVEATVMENIKGKVSGDINLFKRSFDLAYSVNADKIPEIEGIKIDEPLALAGKVTGDLAEFRADGKGDIFGAALDFDALLKDLNPVSINANTEGLHLSKVLAILGQPVYSDSVLSLRANINPNEKGELDGNAVLNLTSGVVYKDVVQKEFNLTLAKNVAYTAAANFTLAGGSELVGRVDVATSLANLKSSATKYNLNTQAASSDFVLDVPSLKELEGLAGVPLQGEIKLYGDVKYTPTSLYAKINSDNLAGGKLEAVLNDDKLSANLIKVKIEEILKILVQPSYASANLNLKADFSSLASKDGKIDIELDGGALHGEVIKKEFNLTLPKTDFSAKSNIVLKNNIADFKTRFLSTLANVEKFDGTFDTLKSELKSSYIVDVKDLSKLGALAGANISGALGVYGDVKYAKDNLQVSAKSDNLAGGKLDVSLDNDKLAASLANAKVEELLKILAQPNYASASLNLKADFSSLANKDGKIDVDVTNGVLVSEVIKKEFNLTLPKTAFSAKSNVTMKGGVGSFDAKILSDLANVEKFAGTFDINKTTLKSNYLFDVKDLSKLNPITKQKMVGALVLNGAANYQNEILHVDGKSDILGGNINFDLLDKKLTLKGANLSALEGLKMLSYPAVFDAKIALNLGYDLNKSAGTFNATSPSGKLVQTQLGDLVKTFLNFDMTADAYENILLDGKIAGENINFLFDMKSVKSSLSIKDGKVTGNALNIPYKLMIEKTDLSGKIEGTTDNPKVSLDTSAYLKNKAKEELNKQIEKNGQKVLDSILKKL